MIAEVSRCSQVGDHVLWNPATAVAQLFVRTADRPDSLLRLRRCSALVLVERAGLGVPALNEPVPAVPTGRFVPFACHAAHAPGTGHEQRIYDRRVPDLDPGALQPP